MEESKLSFWGYIIWAGVGFAIVSVVFTILF